MILKNIDRFTESLNDIFQVIENSRDEKPIDKIEIKELDLFLDDFWEVLKYKWVNLDRGTVNFQQTYENYNSSKNKWNEILEDSQKLSDLEFVIRYSDIGDVIDRLNKEDKLNQSELPVLKRRILEKPPLFIEKTKSSNVENFGLVSLNFYKKNPLNVNIHLKLNKGLNYNLLIIFTIVVKYPKENQILSMEFINNYYQALITVYEIISVFLDLGYMELDEYFASRSNYIPISKILTIRRNYNSLPFEIRRPSLVEPEYIVNYPPIEFKCVYKNLLHPSTQIIFSELIENLNKIKNVIENCSRIGDPKSYYYEFQEEIKEFLKKGKNLFYKPDEIFYEPKNKQEATQEKRPESRKLNLEKVSTLFLKELEEDLQAEIDKQDAGFRSKKEFFDKYANELKISQRTFYTYFDEYYNTTDKFERRERKKQGGGEEYRIKHSEEYRFEYEMIQKPSIQTKIDEDYENLIKYEEAILYLNDGQIDIAKDILYEIYNNYPEKKKNDSSFYLDLLYQLGLSFFELREIMQAIKYFDEGKELVKLTNRDIIDFEIELLRIERYMCKFVNLNKKTSELEKKGIMLIKQKLEVINKKYKFVDNERLENLDIYYINNLKKDPEFKKNQLFREIIQLDLNLLKLKFLKLDLFRRETLILKLNHPDMEIKSDPIIMGKIKNIQYEANKINEKALNNNFNRIIFPFNLMKHYFSNLLKLDKAIYYGEYKYIYNFESICSEIYYDFLKIMLYFEREKKIINPLDRYEIGDLDKESQIEFLIKLCQSKLFNLGYEVIAKRNELNLYKNLNTLIDYAIRMGEKINSNHLVKFGYQVKSLINNKINQVNKKKN